jgi:hypothetical protein
LLAGEGCQSAERAGADRAEGVDRQRAAEASRGECVIAGVEVDQSEERERETLAPSVAKLFGT